jgi:alkanesulfonate monooxygenase SsuD/methylene tetrahydromethanopterin reductase-like flavin-dependent oxidoreductase (luciferase family)
MRALWTDERVDFDGRFWQLEGASLAPRPVQEPLPIWFGGNHPNVLRRAVAHADGFFGAGSQTTAQFADQVRSLRTSLTEAGRDPATMRVAKRVYLAVDDDAARGRELMTAALGRMYGYYRTGDLIEVAVVGSATAVAAGLADVVQAGAELVVLNPLFDEAEQLERLTAEVLPQLR